LLISLEKGFAKTLIVCPEEKLEKSRRSPLGGERVQFNSLGTSPKVWV
jgi:hypothetical protein